MPFIAVTLQLPGLTRISYFQRKSDDNTLTKRSLGRQNGDETNTDFWVLKFYKNVCKHSVVVMATLTRSSSDNCCLLLLNPNLNQCNTESVLTRNHYFRTIVCASTL